MGLKIVACLQKWPLDLLNVCTIYVWDLDKWLLKTGGLLTQMAFITGSTVTDNCP